MDLSQHFHREPIADRGVSVVMPACDAAQCLEAVVARVTETFDRLGRGHEIIIADDGSTDGTADIAERTADKNRRIRVVRHAEPRGHGAALRSGFQVARYPLVLQFDADGQYDPAELERLLGAIDQVDMVCGFREPRPRSFAGRACGFWYAWLLKTVFAVHVRDVHCGFKLFRRAALKRIPIQSSGRFADAEILAKANFMNLLIDEVSVSWLPQSPTSGKRTQDGFLHTLKEAAHVFWRPQFTAAAAPDRATSASDAA